MDIIPANLDELLEKDPDNEMLKYFKHVVDTNSGTKGK